MEKFDKIIQFITAVLKRTDIENHNLYLHELGFNVDMITTTTNIVGSVSYMNNIFIVIQTRKIEWFKGAKKASHVIVYDTDIQRTEALIRLAKIKEIKNGRK